jgi:hypothetical protein
MLTSTSVLPWSPSPPPPMSWSFLLIRTPITLN